MLSPRALLRSKIVEWIPTFKELGFFISDNFEGAKGEIPDGGIADRVDALLTWLQREKRIATLWPVLRKARPNYTAQIDELESAWNNAPVTDDVLAAWLEKYRVMLEKLLDDKLRGNPTWATSLDPIDMLVRERATEGDAAPYVGRLDRVFGDIEPRCALVAEGGSGKSTLVLDLGVRMIRAAMEGPNAPIPIYMPLNHFDSRERALDGMLDGLSASSGLDPKALRELWSSDRQCCFLLDGLNEVRPTYRESCLAAIGLLTQRTHRCIVTSRPSPDVDKLVSTVGASVLEIVPLTRQQVRSVLEQHSVSAMDLDQIAELADTPFLISAIIRIYQGAQQRRMPATVPQLYRALIDDFLFAKREEEAPSEARPTTYDYTHVKRPILAELALRMRREGRTRVTEDAALRSSLKEKLFALRDKFEGELEVMPEKPVAQNLVEELVANGVLSRTAGTLEFWHESVLDYFTGLGLDSLAPEDRLQVVPRLTWRHLDPRIPVAQNSSVFAEALGMYAGLASQPGTTLAELGERHPFLAAHAIGVANLTTDDAVGPLIDRWIAMLDHPHVIRRWVASECLVLSRAVDEILAEKLVGANTAVALSTFASAIAYGDRWSGDHAALLRSCIEETDRVAWARACEVFRAVCTDSELAQLRERRDDPDPATRARVIGALARLNELDVLDDLRAAADDADPAVRAAAVEGLCALDLTYPRTPEATNPT
jgi:hypothetical protein